MKAQVLLSTFNGESYLPALLESLAAQDYPELEILVRDDGSKDATCAMLIKHARSNARYCVVRDEHLGFVKSFFTLVKHASDAAEYYAFCDQDDVWQPNKVTRAVAQLAAGPPDVPALYCSRQDFVDAELRPLGSSPLPSKALAFRNALVECPTVGCTIVFNRALRQLFLHRIPERAMSHDMWMFLLASAFGRVVFDSESRILYRQHAGNTVGVTLGAWQTWKIKVTRFLADGRLHLFVNQAEEFRQIYGALLPAEHRLVLDRLLDSRKSLWRRLSYAATCDVYRQTTMDNYILKARIACNLI